MNDLDKTVLKNCCDFNENLTVFSKAGAQIDVYKSRFLEVDFTQKFIIIDEPSPENQGASLIMKNQDLECFFEYKVYRYLFAARVLDHCPFSLNGKRLHALKLKLPDKLTDGDRREYFRVEVSLKQPITARFLIYKGDSATPLMSTILKGEPDRFEAMVHDLSGAGLCLYSKDKALNGELAKGDRIEMFFTLKPGGDELHLWAEVRNGRFLDNLGVHAWGVRFLEPRQNPDMNKCRNQLLRFVIERQREVISGSMS